MKMINYNGWALRNTRWAPYWGELIPITDPLITDGIVYTISFILIIIKGLLGFTVNYH
jgi:hypothetical protein